MVSVNMLLFQFFIIPGRFFVIILVEILLMSVLFLDGMFNGMFVVCPGNVQSNSTTTLSFRGSLTWSHTQYRG